MRYDTRYDAAALIAYHSQDKAPADGKEDLHHGLKACLSGKQVHDMTDPECNSRNYDSNYYLMKRNPLNIISSTNPTRIMEMSANTSDDP